MELWVAQFHIQNISIPSSVYPSSSLTKNPAQRWGWNSPQRQGAISSNAPVRFRRRNPCPRHQWHRFGWRSLPWWGLKSWREWGLYFSSQLIEWLVTWYWMYMNVWCNYYLVVDLTHGTGAKLTALLWARRKTESHGIAKPHSTKSKSPWARLIHHIQ